MPDETAPSAPLPPFVPKPMPPSGYADPSKVNRAVPLNFPVTFGGKTYDTVYLRRLTVAQVAMCIENTLEERKRDPKALLAFPIFADADDNDITEDVISLIEADQWYEIQELSRDYIPQRFRGPPTSSEPTTDSKESQSDLTPSSGEPTSA